MESKVYVAGYGVISAIGHSRSETLSSFGAHSSGIGQIEILETVHAPRLPVGEVKLDEKELRARIQFHGRATRTALLALHACREAIESSGINDLSRWRTGLISATTVAGMDRTENFFRDFSENVRKGRLRDVVNHDCGHTTGLVADALGITTFITTINTACSSSVNSIIFGTRLIRNGLLDVALVGGADALTRFTLNGFNSLMIHDTAPCRPFDASRNGLNLGEGAGFLVLASDNVLRAENISGNVVVSGFGNTNDAFHQTASSPEGRGSFAAMQLALQTSGLATDDIDYINVHGTGTVNNDESEGTAIRRLFGANPPRLSSTKSFTGHTLGACGGLEAAFSVMAIDEGVVFPSLRFERPMHGIDLVPQTSFEAGLPIRHVMSNSFGFGGNCSSIIFSKV